MIKGHARSTGVMVMGVFLLASGCATKGQLRRGLQEQQAAIQAERAERMAADQRLTGEVAQVAQNVEKLGTELATMNAEFGAQLARLEDGLQLSVPVHFGFDEADVEGEAGPVLDRFAQIVQRNYPGAAITIEGFTDPAGSAAYNRVLAKKRAEAVREELIRRGLASSQLRAVGYGSERQVVPGAAGQAYGAELNRRVVFVIETPPQTALRSEAGGG